MTEDTTTHESAPTKTSDGVGGVFNTPDDSLQTGTDKPQTTDTKPGDNTPPATDDQPPAAGNETEPGTEPATEPGTEPGDTTSEPVTAKDESIEFRGRTFTNLDEFKKTMGHSADEDIRLAGTVRDDKSIIAALNKRIIELEDSETERPYPELQSKEALEAMSNAEQNEYFHKKNRWEDAQTQTKTKREESRKAYDDFAKQLQASMSDAERIMTAEADKYPQFEKVKPYRDQILMASPYLNNRPNTHYDTWLMAMGLTYLDVMAASKQKTAASQNAAKTAAGAVAVQTGEGGKPRTVKTGGAGEESDVVKVYRERRGPVF